MAGALTRRAALMGGSAASMFLFASTAFAGAGAGPITIYAPPRKLTNVDHAVVYRRDTEFAGWPHVMGYWNMGDGEILQQIRSTTTTYPDADAIAHNKLGSQGGVTKMLSFRSKDYGRTWVGPVDDIFGKVDKSMAKAERMGDLLPIDYLDKNVLIANNATNFAAPTSKTNVRVSKDRGHTWSPAIEVPLDGLHSASGMNSVLIRPDGTALIWLIEVIDGFRSPSLRLRIASARPRFPLHVVRDAQGGCLWEHRWRLETAARIRRPALVLPARLHAAERAHAVRAAQPARPRRRHVERSLQERRWRPDLVVPLARQ